MMRSLKKYILLGICTTLICIFSLPVGAHLADSQTPAITVAQGLVEQGRDRYEAGEFEGAVQVLQQAVDTYAAEGNELQLAIALSNLSLAYQQLGEWDQAEAAITDSWDALTAASRQASVPSTVQAQILTIVGRLQFGRGQYETALDTWEQTTALYREADDFAGEFESRFNQARTLQALGFYQRAIAFLTDLKTDLDQYPPSLTTVTTLQSLGDALRVAGQLSAPRQASEQNGTMPVRSDNGPLNAEDVLMDALALATQLQMPEAITNTHLALGDVAYTQALRIPIEDSEESRQGYLDRAIAHYEDANTAAPTNLLKTQAQLSQLTLLVNETEQWDTIQPLAQEIQQQLVVLPPTRTTIYLRIDLARRLTAWRQRLDAPQDASLRTWEDISNLLTTANQQANALGDRRVQSYSLGALGELNEKAGRATQAEAYTRQALVLSQLQNAADITYQWQWQLARLRKQAGDRNGAIAAYEKTLDTLSTLRTDLIAMNPEVQFSFRDSIEPIHRELVALLLDSATPSEAELEQARTTIESLQLAELDNFFREACLDVNEVDIDAVDRQAAVIYPIILDDRLEVIISLPTPEDETDTSDFKSLRRYSNRGVTSDQVSNVVSSLSNELRIPGRFGADIIPRSQEIYGWLIQPFESDLETSNVQTLVFVLDGIFRNIPMSVLYDGDQYLIQRYSIALTPGLQLLEANPIQSQQLTVLFGGISEAHQDFSPLPGVEQELARIQDIVSDNRKLLNQEFTDAAFQDLINDVSAPIVHLATHGQFGSRLDQTFVLTWGDQLNVNELKDILQTTDINRRRPIELLVLSACETAEGDDRAALGMAGVAVQAGARSTIATLWKLSDDSAPLLMERFYQELTSADISKAEALRRAQVSLIDDPVFNRPYYWSPLVLIGNWL